MEIKSNTNQNQFERKFKFKVPVGIKNVNDETKPNVGYIKQILTKKQSVNTEPNDIIADLSVCNINRTKQSNEQVVKSDISKFNNQVVPDKMESKNEQEKSLIQNVEEKPKKRINVRRGTYLNRLYDDVC